MIEVIPKHFFILGGRHSRNIGWALFSDDDVTKIMTLLLLV